MESWSNIVNTAMIGTGKKMTGANDLPENLAEAFALINANEQADKEEKFLQTAAVVFNYRQCGVMPVRNEQADLPMAPPEIQPYCSILSSQVLKDIFSEESIPLLRFWLHYCKEAGQIVQPEMLPALLSAGAQYKALQPLIPACTGKRGEWLSTFNQAWNFSQNQTTEELWQTGTPEQRRSVLKETRVNNPALAREWVMQVWSQEDAATKVSFLEILSVNSSDDDIPFLESLATEKSKKVKDEALALLKQIPGSPLVQQYKGILQQTVSIKKEKALFGLSSKTVLQFQLPSILDEGIFKSGIEKLSNTKDLTDEEFIIFQLLQSVPPSFLEVQTGNNPEQVIQLFQKDAIGKKMIPAMVIAVKKFNDKKWAFAMMQHSEIFYLDIIPLLPLQEQEHYSNRFFEEHPASIIKYATERDNEWGYELAKNILRYAAKNIYQYSRQFYNQHIHLIPGKVANDLEQFTPGEEYMKGAWNNISEYILKLLQLKAQIIQSFNK